MKVKISLTVIIGLILISSLAIAKNNVLVQEKPKLIGTLKDIKGHELGKVYIEDFEHLAFDKADIFKRLYIKSTKNGITKTIYTIKNCVFSNPKGTDITIAEKGFSGYAIEFIHNDSIQLHSIGNEKMNIGPSDPIIIQWNYKKKLFEVYQSPY